MKEVINAKDIFEFDLEKFFDRVNLDAISVSLIKAKVPINIVKKLFCINASAISLKPPYKLNEFEHTIKKLIQQNEPQKAMETPRPLSYMYRVRGIPQGAPTSPVLATLTLHGSILDRGVKTLMYADDGIYYGDIGDTPLITPNSGMVTAGISFNLEKSR